MKVLYIGHYKESGGWGNVATAQILALDGAGVDVVCRNVTLTNDKPNVDPRILELEQKSSKDCDVCIQHVLPHHLVGSDKFKRNIAFLETESMSLQNVFWIENLKMVDEIWVPNEDSRCNLTDDGFDHRKVHTVHHPCDISRYQKKYNPINIPETVGKFKFYTIADITDRKNLTSILTCFHSEFDRSEPVTMVMKLRRTGLTPDQVQQVAQEKINNVKASLRMYPDIKNYHTEVVITDDITDDEICALHQYCDCYVGTSHGEAWSVPTFDAMAFGNFPIASNVGGPPEYIRNMNINRPFDQYGYLVDGIETVCKCSDPAFPQIFTGREMWFQADESETKYAMRYVYEQYRKNPIAWKQKNITNGFKRAKDFSYEAVGERMRFLLEE